MNCPTAFVHREVRSHIPSDITKTMDPFLSISFSDNCSPDILGAAYYLLFGAFLRSYATSVTPTANILCNTTGLGALCLTSAHILDIIPTPTFIALSIFWFCWVLHQKSYVYPPLLLPLVTAWYRHPQLEIRSSTIRDTLILLYLPPLTFLPQQ